MYILFYLLLCSVQLGGTRCSLPQAITHDRRVSDVQTDTRQVLETSRAGCYSHQLNVLNLAACMVWEGHDQFPEVQLRGLANEAKIIQRSWRQILERNLDGASQPPARDVMLVVVVRLGAAEYALSATIIMVSRGGGP